MEVTRKQLESSLAELTKMIDDQLLGIHGPQSLAWHHGREVANFIGGGRAVLLQLAHPPVAAAIADHSRTFDDLRGRFERTFSVVFSMTFGDLASATASARRLHQIHSAIRGRLDDGSAYAANSRDSLRWVYATLVDSIFAVRALCGRPLSPATCEIYYRETKRFALLFGLTESDLPASYCAFRAYMYESVQGPMTAVSTRAKSMAAVLLKAPHPLLAPLEAGFADVTAALLPPAIARAYEMKCDDTVARRARRRGRLWYRALTASPEQLRFFPEYLDAMARIGLRAGVARRLDKATRWGLRRTPLLGPR